MSIDCRSIDRVEVQEQQRIAVFALPTVADVQHGETLVVGRVQLMEALRMFGVVID